MLQILVKVESFKEKLKHSSEEIKKLRSKIEGLETQNAQKSSEFLQLNIVNEQHEMYV